MPRAQAFGPERRLRRGTEFERVFRRGRRLDGRYFLVVALGNDRGVDRLGLTVGRKVGKAVARNRARRLLRESFRRLGRAGAPGLDIVVVAKKEIVGRTQGEVDGEFSERLRRLARQAGRGSAAAPAAG